MNAKIYSLLSLIRQPLLIWILFIPTLVFGSDRYATIDRDVYLQYEYYSLKTEHGPLFILNQPYKLNQSEMRILTAGIEATTYAKESSMEENISLVIKPGWQFLGGNQVANFPSLEADGYIKIGRFKGVNRLIATSALGDESDFHGDTYEWVSAYFTDAYGIVDLGQGVELFGGRTPRNYGIPNEYSLFLSNNAYSFDHFGFSASGTKLKYSYYTGRLNDMVGWDDEGIEIQLGETANTKRYIAFQRLDWVLPHQLQLGLSQATLYGGPDQVPVSAYMNPLNFYYLSQRNQKIQMNGAWQINMFYYAPESWAWYLDFYIDDFIINNDAGVNDRAIHPNRLGVMTKISLPDMLLEKSLTTLRYVRIWNETYVSYRNYENWVFFDKGLGFPYRSYEGIKMEYSIFKNKLFMNSSSFEIKQIGDRSFQTTLRDTANISFPAVPVTKMIEFNDYLTLRWRLVDVFVDIQYRYTFEPLQSNELTFRVGANYRFSIETGLVE
jgi:hypothetical protein